MALKYYCEFCGMRFHTSPAALRCSNKKICRSMNFVPVSIESEWKVRGCALVLSEVVADSLEKNLVVLSEQLKANQSIIKQGQILLSRLRMWNHRINASIKAVTPIGMGKASRVHNALVDFIFQKAWDPKQAIPIMHAAEVALRFAMDAGVWVQENASDKFWFEDTNPDFLLHETVSMPLASYISEMRDRRAISKELDEQIIAWAHHGNGVKIKGHGTLKLMLFAAWQDEARSWQFVQAALNAIMKWLNSSFSQETLRYDYNDDDVYSILLEYIWNDGAAQIAKVVQQKKVTENMRLYFINNRIYVAATNKQEAKDALLKELGIVAGSISAINLEKKILIDNSRMFAREVISGILKPTVL